MKRVLVALFAFLLAFSASTTSQAGFTIPDDVDITSDIALQTIVDGATFGFNAISQVQGSMMPDRQTGKGGSNWVCQNFDDANCRTKDVIFGVLLLPPCSTTVTIGCIDSLSIGSNASTLKPAKMKFEGVSQKIPASPNAEVPAGGSISIWESDGFGDYIVLASLAYQMAKSEKTARITNFDVNLIPTTYIQNAGYFAPQMSQTLDGEYPNVTFANVDPKRQSTLSTKECLFITDGYCFSREEFKTDTRAKISLRVPNNVTGWLFGRMRSPLIEVKPIDSKNNLLSVEATSATVPSLVGVYPKSEVKNNPGVLKWAKSFFYEGDGFLEKRLAEKGLFGGHSSGVDKLEFVTWWGDLLKAYGGTDKRFGINSRWMFGSSTVGSGTNPCFTDKTKLIGLVTTNAPFYESGPPKMVDGVLNYVVAGPHHLGDGKTLFRGVYDLAIRSESARCIYNFTEAPLRAEVTVTSADGTAQDVATESMTERDGWIRLGAYNFTFSTPTVKVKFIQDAPAKKPSVQDQSAPVKQPVASETASKKQKQVTCVKGKVKKVLKAKTCPKGYKKV
ncbi:MAG: hypothetical protein ACO3RC_00125 [Candidatus Nanopelagicaceae bacterium]